MMKKPPLYALLGMLLVFLLACNTTGGTGGNTTGETGGGTGSANFEIALNPTSLNAAPGGSATTQLTVTPKNGFSGTVSLSLVDNNGAAVSGITLTPTSVNVSGGSAVNQNLTVGVGAGVEPGTYNLKVRATASNQTEEADLTLTVTVQSGPSFTISLDPTSLTATQGESRTTQLTLTPQNGFSGTVSLSLVNPPEGVTVSPTSLSVGSNLNLQEDLTIATSADTPVGQHTLTLKAASGTIERTATLTLMVNQATTFTVDTTDDTIDADPGNGKCADSSGKCSLRAAVMEANALRAPVIIKLSAGTYTLTHTSSIDEQGYDLDLMSNITLRGAGRDTTILDGNNATPVVLVHSGTAVLENLTVQGAPRYYNGYTAAAVWNNYGGSLNLKNVVVKNNGGYGVYNSGTATLTNVTVSENQDTGVYNSGTATLTNVTVSENQDTGVYNSGTATLTNVTVSENQDTGVYNSGTATLTNVTVSENQGTGVYNYDDGTATLTYVTVSGNRGGGLSNSQFWYEPILTLTNVTVSGNSDSYSGGGIYNEGTLNIAFSTITNNTAPSGGGLRISSGTAKLKGVILAGNTATTGPECEGTLTSNGYNLIKSNADCSFTRDSSDILNQDPNLGDLADNGGPVQTHLPNPGSPVLDRVPAAACTDLSNNAVSADARGVNRPQNDNCDIGAVEVEKN